MFNFGSANEPQIEAIKTVDGPLLIIAGPGTGKTFTLVQRAIYLIQEHNVKPEQIMIATFTEKAANEIITRISNAFLERGIVVTINDMCIGTFHSICLRLIKENLEYTSVKKNYRTLDAFDQTYLVEQNIRKFREIEDFDLVITDKRVWDQATAICTYVNKLSEELVSPEELKDDENPKLQALGEIMELYNQLLEEQNLLDFSKLQTVAYELLSNNYEILEKIQDQIQYFMIDEYQDTNYIQEQLVLLLAQKTDNVCVVGDDDQGLYRFRGATIRNILEFPAHFDYGKCKIIKLVTNYRSNSDIVDFYNHWMETTSGQKFKFDWQSFRYEKSIEANRPNIPDEKAVIRITSEDDLGEWNEDILSFIEELVASKKIKDLNQIAFLFKSVKNDKVLTLANYLESNGINVYSPRSDMFFKREEIILTFGCLLYLFPNYVQKMENDDFDFMDNNLKDYYVSCIELFKEKILAHKSEYKSLLSWIHAHGVKHSNITRTTDYVFSGLFYQMFEYEPVRNYQDITMSTSGVIDQRPPRNLAQLSQIITKYEYLERLDVFTSKNIEWAVEKFFNTYIRFLYIGGIGEYEDDSEYAPSGCVSFLTIHQSKGMEFPIVVVGSLGNSPTKQTDDVLIEVENKYFARKAYEPYDDIKYFDFWRLYYTGFSRAQDLLVLTGNKTSREPSKYFRDVYNPLPEYEKNEVNLSKFTFEDIKDVNLKDVYSFTSHISVYQNCSMQYKFFKELEFTPIRVASTMYGQLVHQTIEDIHRAAIRNEESTITPENIENWFTVNYDTLSKNEHSYLGEAQKKSALNSVLRYAESKNTDWSFIKEAEVPVSLVKKDYIIEGKIDLVKGKDDTIEIVDFKSEKKPDVNNPTDMERIEHYRKQLEVYAYLEEQKGNKVSKLNLYYTGTEEGSNPVISFDRKEANVEQTIKEFDEVVQHIQAKDFSHKSKSLNTCSNCDFRFYCKR